MEKIIELNRFERTRLANNEPFVSTIDKELKLAFKSKDYKLNNLIVTLSNNGIVKQFRGENVIVPECLLIDGTLKIACQLNIENGKPKLWEISPLLVQAKDETYLQVIDWSNDIENRLAVVEKKIDKFINGEYELFN